MALQIFLGILPFSCVYSMSGESYCFGLFRWGRIVNLRVADNLREEVNPFRNLITKICSHNFGELSRPQNQTIQSCVISSSNRALYSYLKRICKLVYPSYFPSSPSSPVSMTYNFYLLLISVGFLTMNFESVEGCVIASPTRVLESGLETVNIEAVGAHYLSNPIPPISIILF